MEKASVKGMHVGCKNVAKNVLVILPEERGNNNRK
jgi:hypothetical protein